MYKLVAAILLGNGVGGRMATATHYNNFTCFLCGAKSELASSGTNIKSGFSECSQLRGRM